MRAVAWRAVRERRLRWGAWVLIEQDGPWFWVSWHWTRRGAERAAERFMERTSALARMHPW